MMREAAWIATARRLCVGVLAMLMGMELVTGLLLSLIYEPTRMPATTPDGRPATILVGQRVEHVGPFADTVGHPTRPSLVAARVNEVVPSAAAASVRVNIDNAPGGNVARSMHNAAAGWLVILAMIVLVLAAIERTYRTAPSRWIQIVVMVIIAAGAAWTGRILPDDVYAEVSLRIVGQELQHAPLGDALAGILGISPGAPHLARTLFLHLLLGAASVWVSIVLWRERQHLPLVVGASIAIAIAAAGVPMEVVQPRDALLGLSGAVHVEPWWLIRPLHELVGVLGSELAGYIVIGCTLAAIILPSLRRR